MVHDENACIYQCLVCGWIERPPKAHWFCSRHSSNNSDDSYYYFFETEVSAVDKDAMPWLQEFTD